MLTTNKPGSTTSQEMHACNHWALRQVKLSVLLLSLLIGLVGDSPANCQQPRSPLLDSFETYQQLKRESVFGLPWTCIGPVVNSARVESVQLDPTRPGTIYAAFGSGNLWKTTNNGVTWQPKFENQASHGIGDIALAPSNPNVIYLGTGESLKKARNFTIPGTGVYRSDDGGEHWRHLGLADSWHIGEISVHPTNPDIALVAVLGHFWSSNPNRGVYRTADGGKTWQHVLQVDENTGANDVVWGQDNTNIAYASMWENYPGVAGRNSSVYKSDDGGVTWHKSDHGLPSGDKIGRIGLAVSATDANKVYALIDNRGRIKSGAAQVFRSIDGGQNWTRTHQSDLMFLSRIGWYFADIYLNPQNDDEVFALGVRLAHSNDGGKTFDFIGGQVTHVNPSAASGLHLDHCELWINPTNAEHIVLGNDGGLYQSFDKGKTWVHFNNLPTGEFYDIAIDNNSPYRIFAGAQDDATVFGTAEEWRQGKVDQWKYLWIDPWNGGDGCITQVDPDDPDTVYFSAQEGAFSRKNMATNRSKGIRPRLPEKHEGQLDFNFVAPLIISPHDSKTLYLAGNYLFKSSNRGDEWSLISPNIAMPKDPRRHSLAAGAIAESPLVRGLIYVGTDKGAVWVSKDQGNNWSERANQLPVGYVRSIFPSKYVASRAYIAITGINYDDFNTYLYRTEDCGETWTSISNNLPAEPANVIVEDPVHEEILYAGLFRGVYVSTDRGESWSLLGKGLPACSIADLAIQERENDLVVATHGRGIYKMNLSPLHESVERNLATSSNDFLFPIPPAKRPYLSDVRPGLNFRGMNEVPITFWLNRGGVIKVSVTEVEGQPEGPASNNEESISTGNPVVSFNLRGAKGLNQFRWDLVVKTNKSSEPYFTKYREFLDVGKYLLQVETEDKKILNQEFEIQPQ